MRWPVVLSLLLSLSGFRSTVSSHYKPVVIVHGLFDGPKDFKELKDFIVTAHPGTNVTILDKWSNLESLENLWSQVESFRTDLENIMNEAENGIHLICFSQGGLICRGLLSVIPNHNVHTFIALAAPLAGQYGETEYLRDVPHIALNKVCKLCYGIFGTHGILWKIHPSLCDYWNDPCQHAKYLKNNNYLSLINGQKEQPNEEWKKNFLRIQTLVLIGGQDDGVITPWQSSHFGYFNCNKTVVEMTDQEFYQNDAFGLRTLDSRGDVIVFEENGVKHFEWHTNKTVFDKCIENYLN